MPNSELLIMDAETRGALLYRLRDGRFQIVMPGEIGPILSGPDYVLVSEELAAVLENHSGSDLHFEPAVIFDPTANITRTSYREISVRHEVAPEVFNKPEVLTGNVWLCGKSLVVSSHIRDAIVARAIAGVRFSPTWMLLRFG